MLLLLRVAIDRFDALLVASIASIFQDLSYYDVDAMEYHGFRSP